MNILHKEKSGPFASVVREFFGDKKYRYLYSPSYGNQTDLDTEKISIVSRPMNNRTIDTKRCTLSATDGKHWFYSFIESCHEYINDGYAYSIEMDSDEIIVEFTLSSPKKGKEFHDFVNLLVIWEQENDLLIKYNSFLADRVRENSELVRKINLLEEELNGTKAKLYLDNP